MAPGAAARSFVVLLALALAACSDETHPLGVPEPGGGGAAGPRLTTAAAASPYRYACATSIAPDQAAANVKVWEAYNDFKARYVTAAGAPVGARVQMDPGDNYKTSSEGMGYGMLAAAYLGDKAVFDSLWAYASSYLNARGLMKWEVDRYGTASSEYAATDGDEDMAFALVAADRRWGGYATAARALIGNVLAYEVDAATNALEPGDGWGSANTIVNPSMFDPAYYRVFSAYTGVARWDAVREESYAIISRINAKNPYGKGLLPDFSSFAGDSAHHSYDYEWNAIRAPWRLARDAAWYCDARARTQLDQLNAFFRGIGAANIVSGYDLSGAVLPNQWHESGFVAAAASAALTSGDAAWRTSIWNETVRMVGPGFSNYFNDALRLLNLLLASGNMPNPLEPATARLVVDDFERGSVSRWWTFASTGSTIARSVVRPAAVGYGMRVDYSLTSWGGVGISFEPAAGWSGYRGLDFWFYGSGTGRSYRVEIHDNRDPATGATERFEYRLTDNFSGWRYFSVPWSSFSRRTDWQPAGAPNDGLTLTQVNGLVFEPLGAGSGSFRVDRIELVPN
jgi:endo-1,4-beta-D-glucanase Y